MLLFNCRICKKVQNHDQINEFGELPHGLVFVECSGCGVKGIENLTNEVKKVSK